jgi:hypothetical protein
MTSNGADLDLSRLEFRFAKRMPEVPHSYVVRTPANESDYVALFDTIRRDGVDEPFAGRNYRYWYRDGWKYWAMTTDVARSHVINRAEVKDSSKRRKAAAAP